MAPAARRPEESAVQYIERRMRERLEEAQRRKLLLELNAPMSLLPSLLSSSSGQQQQQHDVSASSSTSIAANDALDVSPAGNEVADTQRRLSLTPDTAGRQDDYRGRRADIVSPLSVRQQTNVVLASPSTAHSALWDRHTEIARSSPSPQRKVVQTSEVSSLSSRLYDIHLTLHPTHASTLSHPEVVRGVRTLWRTGDTLHAVQTPLAMLDIGLDATTASDVAPHTAPVVERAVDTSDLQDALWQHSAVRHRRPAPVLSPVGHPGRYPTPPSRRSVSPRRHPDHAAHYGETPRRSSTPPRRAETLCAVPSRADWLSPSKLQGFWIAVWPAFCRNTSRPVRLFIHPQQTPYFQAVAERAALATGCTPAPRLFYTPCGRQVAFLEDLVADGHYLLCPSAMRYDESLVPDRLLRILVARAQNVLRK